MSFLQRRYTCKRTRRFVGLLWGLLPLCVHYMRHFLRPTTSIIATISSIEIYENQTCLGYALKFSNISLVII